MNIDVDATIHEYFSRVVLNITFGYLALPFDAVDAGGGRAASQALTRVKRAGMKQCRSRSFVGPGLLCTTI